MSKLVIEHIDQLITVDPERCTADNPLGIIKDGAMTIEEGDITWVGSSDDLESRKGFWDEVMDAEGQILTPGLIDSHTHAIFAGDRAHEFEMRLAGKTYLEIAKAGGGIAHTVEETRKASEDELSELTMSRLERMLAFGVTTVEVKSGYGLDFETELKCLNVLSDLRDDAPVDIVITFMGAHDIPPEYKGNTDAYVEKVCNEMIPHIAGQAEFCDVFCEEGYFDVAQTRKILECAQRHDLKLKVHAEEFVNLGGAKLAGEMGAISADHLLHIDDAGIQALKAGGTVATLLPGTAFFLRLKDYAPARKLLDAGVPVALATDFNPGSCMTENLQLIMTLAALQMSMLPHEIIRAVTINAARAIGRDHDRGTITAGKRADLVLWDVSTYHELLYHFGVNLVDQVFVAGERVLEPGILEL